MMQSGKGNQQRSAPRAGLSVQELKQLTALRMAHTQETWSKAASSSSPQQLAHVDHHLGVKFSPPPSMDTSRTHDGRRVDHPTIQPSIIDSHVIPILKSPVNVMNNANCMPMIPTIIEAPTTVTPMPHGLTVQELKELTRMRLAKKAFESPIAVPVKSLFSPSNDYIFSESNSLDGGGGGGGSIRDNNSVDPGRSSMSLSGSDPDPELSEDINRLVVNHHYQSTDTGLSTVYSNNNFHHNSSNNSVSSMDFPRIQQSTMSSTLGEGDPIFNGSTRIGDTMTIPHLLSSPFSGSLSTNGNGTSQYPTLNGPRHGSSVVGAGVTSASETASISTEQNGFDDEDNIDFVEKKWLHVLKSNKESPENSLEGLGMSKMLAKLKGKEKDQSPLSQQIPTLRKLAFSNAISRDSPVSHDSRASSHESTSVTDAPRSLEPPPSPRSLRNRPKLAVPCPELVRERSFSDASRISFEMAESVLLTPTPKSPATPKFKSSLVGDRNKDAGEWDALIARTGMGLGSIGQPMGLVHGISTYRPGDNDDMWMNASSSEKKIYSPPLLMLDPTGGNHNVAPPPRLHPFGETIVAQNDTDALLDELIRADNPDSVLDDSMDSYGSTSSGVGLFGGNRTSGSMPVTSHSSHISGSHSGTNGLGLGLSLPRTPKI